MWQELRQERTDNMRNTTEFTRGYQIWLMIRREIIGVAACALVEFLLFMPSFSNDIFRNVSGVLFSVINFLIIYDSAAALGKLDTKSYTKLEFDIKWSVLWGIIIGIASVVSIVIFKLNWRFGAVDGVLSNPVSVVYNILFFIWQAPYLAFFVMTPAYVPIGVVILSVILPIVASVAGYISGKNNFALLDKIRGIMFEKDNKDI